MPSRAKRAAFYRANRVRLISKQKEYYRKNRARILKQKRAHYFANLKTIKKRRALYRKLNRTAILKSARVYCRKYPEKVRARWLRNYRRHRTTILAWQDKYRRSHRVLLRKKLREYYRRNRARFIAAATHRRIRNRSDHPPQMLRMADQKLAELKRMVKTNCVYCGKTTTRGRREIDHVRPLARGGKHCASNLAASCKPCNREKRAKILHLEWIPPLLRK